MKQKNINAKHQKKQHAFLMLVHKQPLLFGRIARLLHADNHYIVVHIDARIKGIEDYRNEVKGLKNVIFLPKRKKIHHCGHSQFLTTIYGLRYIRTHLPQINFIHLISGQDYPMRSNEVFDGYFDRTESSYVCLETENFHNEQMKYRYPLRMSYWYPSNPNSLLAHLYYRMGIRKLVAKVFKRPIPDNLWGGWLWFTWNMKTTDYVLEYIDMNPCFLRRFMYTSAGDELIFNTLLHGHEEELDIKPFDPLRYVSWSRIRPNTPQYLPYTLNEEDFDLVFSTKSFFCRKVDLPESEKLLDMIDARRGEPFDMDGAPSPLVHLWPVPPVMY